MTSGVTPTCCGSFAADHWLRCGRKWSRSAPAPMRASCRAGIRSVGGTGNSGLDGLTAVVDQLAGVPLPASAIESLVLPPRVRDYSPAMLDELLASGEVVWSGGGSISAGDGWVAFHPADTAPLSLAAPTAIELTAAHHAILDALAGGGAFFFRQLAQTGIAEQELKAALWELDLGRFGHRRHLRAGPRDARRRAGQPQTVHPGAPAGPRRTSAPAQPLQRCARPVPRQPTPRWRDGGQRCRCPSRTRRCGPTIRPRCCCTAMAC